MGTVSGGLHCSTRIRPTEVDKKILELCSDGDPGLNKKRKGTEKHCTLWFSAS